MADIREILVEKGADIVVIIVCAGVALALIGGTIIDLAGAFL